MRCRKHPFDKASDICSHCGGSYCPQCLVYPAGTGRPGFCVQCAVGRSVRSRQLAAKPIGRRELKARRRALADWLATVPDTPEKFVELAPIPEVSEDEMILPRGSNTATIEWRV